MTSSSSPVTLVTGANRSIGLQVVRELVRLGHTVFLGARDVSRGKAAARELAGEGLDVHVVHIDLDDPSTHEQAAASVGLLHGRLDVLVNNAAIIDGADGPATVMPIHAVRRVFDTNVLGTLSVTRALLPMLRQGASSRIINLSSALGSIGEAIDRDSEFAGVRLAGYAISKAALNMLTVQLAVELEPEGIAVNAVDPGFTATDMNGHQGYQSLQQGAAEVVRLATLPLTPSGGFLATGKVLPW